MVSCTVHPQTIGFNVGDVATMERLPKEVRFEGGGQSYSGHLREEGEGGQSYRGHLREEGGGGAVLQWSSEGGGGGRGVILQWSSEGGGVVI